MTSEQHEWYWKGYNDAKKSLEQPALASEQDLWAGATIDERWYITRQPKQEPVYHLRQYGDVTKAEFDRYLATGDINATPPQPEQEPTRSQKMRDAGITRRPKGWDKEQEQEPVAWLSKDGKGIWFHEPDASLNATPLYTTPPYKEEL